MRKKKAKATRPDPAAELLLQRLKELAERTGATVREERLVREVGYHVRSGGCRVDGQDVLLLDSGAALGERIEAALEFLSNRDLEGVFLEPDLRRMLRGQNRGDPGDEARTA